MNKNFFFTLVPLIALGISLVFSATATPGYGYVSIPAAAFHPKDTTSQYNNYGNYLKHTSGNCNYIAPVQLPHGVTVTKLIFYFRDNSAIPADYGTVQLARNNNNFTVSAMAGVTSNDEGDSSTYDDTINNATIDNSQYSYYLSLILCTEVVYVYDVTIEYTYPVSLPLIMK